MLTIAEGEITGPGTGAPWGRRILLPPDPRPGARTGRGLPAAGGGGAALRLDRRWLCPVHVRTRGAGERRQLLAPRQGSYGGRDSVLLLVSRRAVTVPT
jgi:hypothetical protein